MMSFDVQLQNVATELQESLITLRTAAAQMRSSKQLRTILVVVLVMGNFMNHGTVQDHRTKGFTLESLLKLLELKSPLHRSVSLVHYVAHRMFLGARRQGLEP